MTIRWASKVERKDVEEFAVTHAYHALLLRSSGSPEYTRPVFRAKQMPTYPTLSNVLHDRPARRLYVPSHSEALSCGAGLLWGALFFFHQSHNCHSSFKSASAVSGGGGDVRGAGSPCVGPLMRPYSGVYAF